MPYVDEQLLEKFGWTLECESPFEIRHEDGSFTYDVYDWEKGYYIDPKKADTVLRECGFFVVPTLFYGKLNGYETLETMANGQSEFTVGAKREGIVVKVSNGEAVTTKFKMVRQGFEQGCLLGDEMRRNKPKLTVR